MTIPLTFFRSFLRFFDILLKNCGIELDLSWKKDCILIEHHNNITGANFMINYTKLYVSVVTLSINNNTKFLENIKEGFKRTSS